MFTKGLDTTCIKNDTRRLLEVHRKQVRISSIKIYQVTAVLEL